MQCEARSASSRTGNRRVRSTSGEAALPPLPENYFLSFIMEADSLSEPFTLVLTSPFSNEQLQLPFSGSAKGFSPSRLNFVRNGKTVRSHRRRMYTQLRYKQKVKVEIIRNTAALEIRFNGKTAFTASPYFPGGRFFFLARGGMKDITIEEFKIHDAQPY